MTTIKAVDRRDPMVFPAADYALAWVACLAGYLPGLKYRSREALLRLSGWPHWNDMVAACNPAKHCVTEDIGRNPAQRLASLAEHRAIMQAIDAGDAEAAQARMHAHLLSGRAALAALARSV